MRTNFVSLLDLVELFGRYSFDKLAMRLKFSLQFPRPSSTTGQVTKRSIADLALHDLLAIPHRELERHQIGVMPNSLASRQRHEPAPLLSGLQHPRPKASSA